jgi:hypothetical protein
VTIGGKLRILHSVRGCNETCTQSQDGGHYTHVARAPKEFPQLVPFVIWRSFPLSICPKVGTIFGDRDHSPTLWLEERDGAETLIEAPIVGMLVFVVGTENDSEQQPHLQDI